MNNYVHGKFSSLNTYRAKSKLQFKQVLNYASILKDGSLFPQNFAQLLLLV